MWVMETYNYRIVGSMEQLNYCRHHNSLVIFDVFHFYRLWLKMCTVTMKGNGFWIAFQMQNAGTRISFWSWDLSKAFKGFRKAHIPRYHSAVKPLCGFSSLFAIPWCKGLRKLSYEQTKKQYKFSMQDEGLSCRKVLFQFLLIGRKLLTVRK
jgi:hypothetical protein